MKTLIVVALLSAAAGGGLMYRFNPPQTKTETVIRDRIVTHTVVKRADGTVESDTTKTEDKQERQNQVVVAPAKPDWHISAGSELDRTLVPSYRAQVDRRILGPIFIGGSISTRGAIGVNLGFEF